MTDTQKVSIETVARNIEAVMMVMDEPMSVVALAGALEVPVGSVTAALESLVADYDGQSGGVERGFELRERRVRITESTFTARIEDTCPLVTGCL